MADEQTSTPPVQGDVPQTGTSQPTVPPSQETVQQEQTGNPSVEGTEQQTSSEPEGTRKPSDFYRSRERGRRRMESIEGSVKSLTDKFDDFLTMQQTAPQVAEPFDNQRFLETPEDVLNQRDQQLEERIRDRILNEELPKIESERDFKRNQQEALGIIFPKDSFDSKETLSTRANKNPEKLEAIQDLLETTGLDELSKTDPTSAASIALELYNSRNKPADRKTNPTAIDKKLMGNTATGSSNTGGTRMPTLAEVQAQRKALDSEADLNPALRENAEFRAKRVKLSQDYISVARELEKKESGKI